MDCWTGKRETKCEFRMFTQISLVASGLFEWTENNLWIIINPDPWSRFLLQFSTTYVQCRPPWFLASFSVRLSHLHVLEMSGSSFCGMFSKQWGWIWSDKWSWKSDTENGFQMIRTINSIFNPMQCIQFWTSPVLNTWFIIEWVSRIRMRVLEECLSQ